MSGSRSPAALHWTLPVLVGLALALDLFRLGTISLWGDEAVSVELATNPLPVSLGYLWNNEINMVLYYLLLHGWLSFTGALGLVPDEFVVRAPSVFFGVIGVVVVFWLGRRFWGSMVGALGATLYALNNLPLGKAREARSYSLELLLILLAWCALFAALIAEERRRRWWVAYVVMTTLAVYAHVFSALVVAAQVVAFAGLVVLPNEWRARARQSVPAMAASVAAIGIGVLPIAVHALLHGSSNTWLPAAGLYELARLAWNIAGHSVVDGLVLGVALAIAALTVANAGQTLVRRVTPRAPIIALACWVVVPVVLSFGTTQAYLNLHLFAWPYLVVVVPALCLLAAIGVSSMRRPAIRRALALIVVAAAALATPIFGSPPPQDFRNAARWISERYETGDGLLATTWSSSVVMGYYARIDAIPRELLADTPRPWVWNEPQPVEEIGARLLDPRAIAIFAATHRRVFIVDSLLGAESPDVKGQSATIRSWFDETYPLVTAVAIDSVSPVSVRLYETRAGPPG